MIKFNSQVPSVYPGASRDFQYLSWLIDIVFNSVKHNVDSLYDLPNAKADAKLTELLAMTLGFKVKRNYDQKQLAALVAVLPKILKYKGTKTALYFAGNALIAASGAVGNFSDRSIFIENGELNITIPKDLVDVSLFTDLLPYILPAGITCHIIRTNQITKPVTTELGLGNKTFAELIPDLAWDDSKYTSTGLANMFNTPGAQEPTFANFTGTDFNKILNVGLLDNSIIPTLKSAPMRDPLDKGPAQDEPNADVINNNNAVVTEVEK